jgi:hypothetical protein
MRLRSSWAFGLAALILTTAPAALAQPAPDYWLVGYTNTAQLSQRLVMDVNTLHTQDNVIDGWETSIVDARDPKYATGVRYITGEYQYDCAAKRLREGLELTHYGDGHTTSSPDWAPWDQAADGTIGASALAFACAAPGARGSVGEHLPGVTLEDLLRQAAAAQ